VPLLPVHNRFACLEVENEEPPLPSLHDDPPVKVTTNSDPIFRSLRLRPWERRLPKGYVVAATPGPKSLVIKVEVQMTDTVEVKSGPALVDCRATGQFMDRAYVERNRLTTQKLHCPIPLFNVDRSPNEAGSITKIVNAVLHYDGHTERTSFAVTSLGKQDIILGFTWLQEHNPEINWQTHKILMSRCPDKCRTCCSEVQAKRKEQRKAERHIRVCRSGPHPLLVEVELASEFEPNSDTNSASDSDSDPSVVRLGPEDTLAEGDHLLYVNLPSEAEHIQATGTTSQRLAEASQKHVKAESEIPEYLREFEDDFANESFDALPVRKVWDHAIELEPGSKPTNCKVYPLSPKEQLELDVFLKENLRTGRICPSKSPMASPVFFIKKKDGSLPLIQDYRALTEGF
jgi:hypothetical protein